MQMNEKKQHRHDLGVGTSLVRSRRREACKRRRGSDRLEVAGPGWECWVGLWVLASVHEEATEAGERRVHCMEPL